MGDHMLVLKNLILLTTFFLIVSMFANASEKHNHNPLFQKDWKMLASINSNNMHETFKSLADLEIDVAGVDVNNKIIDILINDYDYKNLEQKGFDLTITEVKGITAGPDEEYKNSAEIELIVQEFSDRFPDITKRISIGKSLEGRDIWAIKISDNPETHEVSEPAVLFNSMHHAREIMTPEVSIDIIETLLNGYNSDEKITKWINNYEIWVIPMFNVDGNNKMWTDDKWWRKNARGGYGVDLNRNYPTGWNKCNGSSGYKSSQTYRGPSPASEPETQAMMKFIKEVRPVFDISYHSYSELVIYPLGCSPERATNSEVIEKIGKEIAQKLNYEAGTAWELLYNADGGDIDWMYDAYQVIPYVIELNSRKQGFHPKYAKWRDKTVLKNRAGWMHLLERLEQSGVRGQLKVNNIIQKDFVVEVRKAKTNELLQMYTGHESGMYHLVLNPGDYKLKFLNKQNLIIEKNITINMNLMELNVSL
jgi:carboxypeptidase T